MATSAAVPTRTRRSTWDRFSDACRQCRPFDGSDPLDLPASQVYFERVLEASISLCIARQHFEAVMTRNSSTDLDICASNDAQHAARRHLDMLWDAYIERYADNRRQAAPALMQAAA